MHPIKLLAKLTPKTLNLNAVGGGSSIDVIDWRYAAHALSGLPKEATDWALFRFAGHDDKFNTIVRTLTMVVTLYIKINRFKIKPETLNGIVRSAILEFIQPVCNECSGTGWVIIKVDKEECSKCRGRGRKIISNRERCRVIGITSTSYCNNHDIVTKEILHIISRWEVIIIKNIREKMGDVA